MNAFLTLTTDLEWIASSKLSSCCSISFPFTAVLRDSQTLTLPPSCLGLVLMAHYALCFGMYCWNGYLNRQCGLQRPFFGPSEAIMACVSHCDYLRVTRHVGGMWSNNSVARGKKKTTASCWPYWPSDYYWYVLQEHNAAWTLWTRASILWRHVNRCRVGRVWSNDFLHLHRKYNRRLAVLMIRLWGACCNKVIM